ncbi:MAG TPA: DMT family transporter [Candidatus Limnocylindria bacterium]|nr:DMT family transporter [Candidatus Limnocylindria bacterium]
MKQKAVAIAVLTTVLWSVSYILNKLAFAEGIGPLTLAGTRYLLASMLLSVPDLTRKGRAQASPPLGAALVLGVLGYAVAQGLQYLGQGYLTPTQSSLFLSVGNTSLVLLMDRFFLRENQGWRDLAGLGLMVAGIALYYAPFGQGGFSAPGMALMALSSIGYALNLNCNRALLKKTRVSPRLLAARPMLAGSLVMLAFALATEGVPPVTPRLLLILAYLAGVSGALGFLLWTRAQAVLSAFESSSIQNLLLIEIALLDLAVFGRALRPAQAAGILVVFASVMWVQFRRRRGVSRNRA